MPAFVIMFREGLEAFLIVALVLAYLRKTGRRALVPPVQWGIAAGVAVSVVAGLLLYRASNQELLEGPLALVAAIAVATLTVQMWRAGRRMKDEIETQVSASASHRAGAAFGVFLFTAFMIGREGMETVLLLVQIRGMSSLVAGGIAGMIAAAIVGWAWARFGRRVPLTLFFQTTALFLIVFVVQLTIKAVHEMSEQQLLPWSETIHTATESWGPESAFGHALTYLLVALPAAWLIVSRIRGMARPALKTGAAVTR